MLHAVDFKLEVVTLPVSDVDRAKAFYKGLGWREDADFTFSEESRVVQFTPPGSPASIHFGKGLVSAQPGAAQRQILVVDDIDKARAELIGRGVDVSEVFHREGANAHVPGPDPQRATYSSLASFEDPDGNGWLLQEITTRLPGR
jgi:catechol 2,3-dioxygenase-like lactoylglutathione lyase family enzyme